MAYRKRILALAVLCSLTGCASTTPPTPHAKTGKPLARATRPVPAMSHYYPRYLAPGQRTVDDVLSEFGPYVRQQFKPYFEKAGLSYPPREITLLALKQEKKLELWARNDGPFRLLRDYAILAASGTAGPKLRQGDKQVPEGVYRIVGFNPNSNFHLSLKLNYPNEFDQYHAYREGRSNPGSDIFIHGKALSVGCLAMGDEAIEQLFILAAHTGRENIRVIIAPRDPRTLPLRRYDPDFPPWTAELYATIEGAVKDLANPLRMSSQGAYNAPRGYPARR